MSATPIQEARRILDRAAKAVVEARVGGQPPAVVGRNVLESIHRFTSAVGSNLHLDRARADCERDLDEKRARLLSRKTDLLGQLNQLRQEAAAKFPAIVEPAQPGGPEDPFSHRASLTGFDRWMDGAGKEPAKIDEGGDHLGCAKPAEILCVILRRLLPEDASHEDNDPRFTTLLRAQKLKDELTKVRRTQILLGKTITSVASLPRMLAAEHQDVRRQGGGWRCSYRRSDFWLGPGCSESSARFCWDPRVV